MGDVEATYNIAGILPIHPGFSSKAVINFPKGGTLKPTRTISP